ncbi:deaminase domain-containing protein [Mechercharimyces sp. CAU 1602]|uniref:deaminase domain-containing protein n=1 Tax=Mechercharimyces sp. CAU 1602 TaxID=2973933 RepID=UPI002163F8B6|nr:deaminase domain-containing protein [Mechercharimyces sp. CAU 1602]MCS1351882.1 hypothetical protein [Mechercharimyces sp. CAU 1602]
MSEEQVPLKPAHLRRFKTLKVDGMGNINTEEGYDRAAEPIPKLLEQVAEQLQDDVTASGTLKIRVKFPPSISCQWVMIQFHKQYPHISLQILDLEGRDILFFAGDPIEDNRGEGER